MSERIYNSYQRGIELLENGKPAQASVLLEQAKEDEPDKASIREALGRAYYNFGRFEAARHNFKKALAINPTNDYAHFGLALCLERSGMYRFAFGHVKLALAMRPGNKTYQRLALRLEMRALAD